MNDKQINFRANAEDWSAFLKTALVKEQGAANVLRRYIRLMRSYANTSYSVINQRDPIPRMRVEEQYPHHLVDIQNALHLVLKSIPAHMANDPIVTAIEKILKRVHTLANQSPLE